MGIRFYCPNGHKLNVKEFQAGRRGICPYCGAKVRIPLESTRPSSKELRAARQPATAGAGKSSAAIAQPPTSQLAAGGLDAAGTTSVATQPVSQPLGPSVLPGGQQAADQSLQATPLEPLQPIGSVAPTQPKGFISAPLTDAQAASAKQSFGTPAGAGPSGVEPGGTGAFVTQPAPTLTQLAPQSSPYAPATGMGTPAYGAAMAGYSSQPTAGPAVAAMGGTYGAAPASMLAGQPGAGVSAAADPLTEAGDVVWYVRPPSGGQYGPATREIMRTWLAEGRISADSLVWREGWRDWQAAGSVFPQLVAAPAFPVLQSTLTPSGLPTYASAKRRSRSTHVIILVLLVVVVLISAAVFLWVLLQSDAGSGTGQRPSGRRGTIRATSIAVHTPPALLSARLHFGAHHRLRPTSSSRLRTSEIYGLLAEMQSTAAEEQPIESS